MAKYELVVIFDPFLQEAETNALVDRVKEAITRRGGAVTNVDVWGKKRLAYAINKKPEGFYVVITFEGEIEGTAVAEIERSLRLNESVLREMVTRVPMQKPQKKKVKKAKGSDGAQSERRYHETYSAGQAGQAVSGPEGPGLD